MFTKVQIYLNVHVFSSQCQCGEYAYSPISMTTSRWKGSFHNRKYPLPSASRLLPKNMLQVLPPGTCLAAPMTHPTGSRRCLRGLLFPIQQYDPDRWAHNLNSEAGRSWDLLALFIYQLPLNARDSHGSWDPVSPSTGHITPPQLQMIQSMDVYRVDKRPPHNPRGPPASQWGCWTSHKKYVLTLPRELRQAITYFYRKRKYIAIMWYSTNTCTCC